MLSVTAAFPGASRTIVISPDQVVLDRAEAAGAQSLFDFAGDLNAALNFAAGYATDDGADGILIVPVDLPRSRPGDLQALASCQHGVAIAPDRRGIGTNALYVSPPDALLFRFGGESFKAHLAGAQEAGLNVEILNLPNLAFDIDTPDDFREWRRQEATLPVRDDCPN
jgi:2-phospho-L-lactate guanylyltransferase